VFRCSSHEFLYGRYTFDPTINTLAAIDSTSLPRRIDRILIRSPGWWQPAAAELICTDPFTVPSEDGDLSIYPSDHYGVKAVVEFVDGNSQQNSNNDVEEEQQASATLTREEQIALRPQLRIVHTTAVVVIPPRRLWSSIQAIRKVPSPICSACQVQH